MKKTRSHVEDLRGAGRLAVEATQSVTALVEAMHRTIGSGPAILGQPLAVPMKLMTGLVYGSIRGVTKLVGAGLDQALAQLDSLIGLGHSAPGPERDAVLAALNGVLGDYLTDTGNPLALDLELRQGGMALDLDQLTSRARGSGDVTGKILVMVHGSCMSDRGWQRLGHDHGAALARDLGYTPIYLSYNSGLHVSTNGRAFARALDQLLARWPVAVEKLVLLTHSMGGLVARAACHVAEDEGLAWRPRLDALVCLGTPHHGAPLERGGSWVDLLLSISRYSAPLARLGHVRSAGITDLRYGSVLDEHWQGRDRFELAGDPRRALALPAGVATYLVAGSLTPAPKEHDRLTGDGMVPVDSALGRHSLPALTLDVPADRQKIAYGVGHLDLLNDRAVYDTLLTWLAS